MPGTIREILRTTKEYRDVRRLLDVNDCYSFFIKTPNGSKIPIRNISDLANAINIAERLMEMGLKEKIVIGGFEGYRHLQKRNQAFRLALIDHEAMKPYKK